MHRIILLLSLLTACSSSSTPQVVPTEFVLPTETTAKIPEPTSTPSEISPSATLQPTEAPSETLPPSTETEVPTTTLPTHAPIPLINIPAATNPPAFSIQSADIVIPLASFQDELNRRLNPVPDIETAVVTFVTGDNQGMVIRMTASGGTALVTGDITIDFQLSDGLVAIIISSISIGSGDPPEVFRNLVMDTLSTEVVNAFDALIQQQLGSQHDLVDLTFTENTIEMTLFVPEG